MFNLYLPGDEYGVRRSRGDSGIDTDLGMDLGGDRPDTVVPRPQSETFSGLPSPAPVACHHPALFRAARHVTLRLIELYLGQ